jgi:hypothetical protein
LGVKRLTKIHDVDAMLTQRWAYWRTWICLTRCNLQLDIGFNLLSHTLLLAGTHARAFDPSLPGVMSLQRQATAIYRFLDRRLPAHHTLPNFDEA